MNISLEIYLKAEAMKAENLDRVFRNLSPRYGYIDFMDLGVINPKQKKPAKDVVEDGRLNNELANFLDSRNLSLGKKNESDMKFVISATDLYDEYLRFCNGCTLSQTKFGIRMTDIGFTKVRGVNGWKYVTYILDNE